MVLQPPAKQGPQPFNTVGLCVSSWMYLCSHYIWGRPFYEGIFQVLPITSPDIIFWGNIKFSSFYPVPKANNEAVDLHNSNMSDTLDSIAQFKTGI